MKSDAQQRKLSNKCTGSVQTIGVQSKCVSYNNKIKKTKSFTQEIYASLIEFSEETSICLPLFVENNFASVVQI